MVIDWSLGLGHSPFCPGSRSGSELHPNDLNHQDTKTPRQIIQGELGLPLPQQARFFVSLCLGGSTRERLPHNQPQDQANLSAFTAPVDTAGNHHQESPNVKKAAGPREPAHAEDRLSLTSQTAQERLSCPNHLTHGDDGQTSSHPCPTGPAWRGREQRRKPRRRRKRHGRHSSGPSPDASW